MAPKDPKAKKGRPSKSSLAKLEEEGRNDENAKHKCQFCPRVFPRKKSKDAHELTHTGLKPYRCNFPGCSYASVQSSHLKLHLYRHTGEKPFACPATGCRVRYRHSNRLCSRHNLKLIRDGKEVIRTDLENLSEEQIQCLQLYTENKFGKATKLSNPKTSPTEVSVPSLAESVHLDEKPFDKEPLISSNPSSSSAHNPEEMNICDSLAQPPKKPRFTKKQAALALISLSNSHISSNPSSSPAHNPEEMNIRDSFAQAPKEEILTVEEVALVLISFKDGPSRRNAYLEEKNRLR